MLAFVDVVERKETITIDGYTSNKTEKGIIRDVARAIQKFSKIESECLMEMAREYNEEINNPFVNPEDSDGGYFFQYENVGCASKINDETGEMEYKDGFHNYFCIRIVK